MPPLVRMTLLLALALTGLARAGEVKFLEEVRHEDDSRSFHPLNPDRFVEVGREWEPGDQKARLGIVHYKVFDLVERKLVRVSIPLTAFREANGAVLGPRDVPTLVHYDGAVSTMLWSQFKATKTVAKWFAQYDHRTGRFSELLKLGDHDPSRLFGELTFDPQERYLYFAAFIDEAGDIMKHKPTSMLLQRIGLKDRRVDWELEVKFPKRTRPLQLTGPGWLFDPSGKRLALIEYDDQGGQRQGPVEPPAQVYVIDVETKAIDTYPVPLSAYARFFTPDGKYLVLGSNELGEIIRIDLVAKKIDLRTKGLKLLHAFALSPSGKTFLSFANTELVSPKVVEVRRVDDLKLVASIPVRLLIPGTDHAPHALMQADGRRRLLFVGPEKKQAPKARSLRLYELPDDVDSGTVAGASAAEVSTAKGIVAARLHADAKGLQVNDDPRTGDPQETFASVAVNPAGDAFVLGIRSGNSDGDYKPGRTTPVVLKVDAAGKLKWERPLGKKGFVDYEAGGVAATADGGCVVHVMSYVSAGAAPVVRVVKLDAAGRVQWDFRFRGAGGLNTPLADVTQLLPNGHVALSGRLYPAKDVKKAWSAELDPKGQVVFDRVED